MAGVRLPDRFPVGTHYVVEGMPDENGELTITSRCVVLPNGTEFSLPVTPKRIARQMSRRAATQRQIRKRSPRAR